MSKYNARFNDDATVVPVETTYETAYSPMHECEVRLTHAYTDDFGRWIFVGNNEREGIAHYLFRRCELENFKP